MRCAHADVLQVVAVLEQTRSSYLTTFLSLRKAIQQEAVVAEDNLKFLQCLEQPCQTLATASAQVRLQDNAALVLFSKHRSQKVVEGSVCISLVAHVARLCVATLPASHHLLHTTSNFLLFVLP